jgi:O-antigen/teichoic acid export membrane protein
MSLKKHIAVNYLSQLYVTLVGIVMVPLYITHMGAEAYGLVGFFAMLQAWFTMLDVGLTPTLARESARFYAGATNVIGYRRLVRALEGVFFLVALVGGFILFLLSGYIASDWLHAIQLSTYEVRKAIEIMALIIALRWMCGLYRGAISGLEKWAWLGSYNALIATLRYGLVLPVLIFIGVTPSIFFGYQLGVAFLELCGLMLYFYHLLPPISKEIKLPWDWKPLQPVLKFSLTIAFTSSVWVMVTQTDKLVLSKIIPLAEYGYFTLAILVASGVMAISNPISGVIMSRMSKLVALSDHDGVIRVYRQATQLVAVLAGSASITLALCAESILSIWTGDRFLASQAAPILALYALGNGVLVVAAFPYYLQYAKGDLRLHLIGNAIFVVLLIPLIIWASIHYGAVGAGYVWLGTNLSYFILWIPVIHNRFESRLNIKWYLQDTLAIFSVSLLVAYWSSIYLVLNNNRWSQLLMVCLIGLLTLLAGSLASSEVRSKIGSLSTLCKKSMRIKLISLLNNN